MRAISLSLNFKPQLCKIEKNKNKKPLLFLYIKQIPNYLLQ